MITLTNFKDNVKNIAKSNRFLVDIEIVGLPFKREMKYLAQDASIPNRIASSVPVKYFGMKLELPGDYDHADLIIKFLNHYDWNIRNYFEDWFTFMHELDFNSKEDSQVVLENSYLKISQIGNNEGDVLAEYYFFNVFPKEISDIKLSMGEDNIETFDVTFAYSHWTRSI